MPSPLFSTYRGGENRVTSSLVAVFERIELSIVERVLGMAAAESALSLVAFVNQVSGEQATVPDAEISANFRYLFEVKIAKETIRPEQITGHLEHLRGTHLDEKLFVVTPDASKPRGLVPFDADPRVHWTNFLTLTEAIQQVIDDPAEAVGERTSFLLRELQGLFRAEGLIDFADTVVVAARTAYGEYFRHSAYVCQPRAIVPGGGHSPWVLCGRRDQTSHCADRAHRRRSYVL